MGTILKPVILLMVCAAVAAASSTQIWEQKTVEDFEKGETSGVSITTEGRLELSPPFDLLFETGDPYVWALAQDSRGRVFVAGGNEGKVYVYSMAAAGRGTGSVFFQAKEIEVHALAVDAADNLYVGSSPDGKVYRVTPDGASSVFFEPKSKYIWSLTFDKKGNLYVGTGDKGELFKVDREGRGTTIYKNGDKHIRSLAPYGADGVVAGTDGHGRILRVSSDGRVFVLYDASVREITSVAAAEDGTIYAAGMGTLEGGPQAMAMASARAVTLSTTMGGLQPLERLGQPREPQTAELYRIAPDGYPRRIWKSDKVMILAVAIAEDGSALLGSGDRGTIYRMRADMRAPSALVRAGGSQVTALLVDGRTHSIYAGTSNLGRLYRTGAGHAASGSYESQVKDTGIFSKWGKLRWRQQAPPGTDVKFCTRSGNTQEPDSTWSPWSESLTQPSGQQVASPQARFFQWKVVLTTSKNDATPMVDNVELAYLPRNVAPELNTIVIHQRDFAIERMPMLQDQQAISLQSIGQFPGSGVGAPGSFGQGPQLLSQQRPVPSRTSMRKGWQSITWEARDDNGDTLSTAVYIKGEGESGWKLLKDRIEESFFSWDTTNFPDGAYTVKLVISDSSSNPPDLTLQTERISERLYIDNTAPTITVLGVVRESNDRVRMRVRATDGAMWLSKAEYGVNGGEYHQVFPSDGVFDSETEEFDFIISGIDRSEHTIVFKVWDRAGNLSSAKHVVR
jgi:sugar lactone lactonase YvrE